MLPPGPPWRNITFVSLEYLLVFLSERWVYLVFHLGCRIARSVVCGRGPLVDSPCQREGREYILGLP